MVYSNLQVSIILFAGIRILNYLQGSTISDFDRSCTIKVFGYSSTTEYYRDASNINRLHLIKKPLICIQAEDDPFALSKSMYYNVQAVSSVWCVSEMCNMENIHISI